MNMKKKTLMQLNVLTSHVTCLNMIRFPQSRSKNIIIGILTLGFLEVVEMEYDEGSEWPITLGRLDVFV